MANKIEPPVEIKFEPAGDSVTLHTVEEARDWAKKEHDFWKPLEGAASLSTLGEAVDFQVHALAEIMNGATETIKELVLEKIANLVKKIVAFPVPKPGGPVRLYSKTPEAEHILELHELDPDLAASTLRAFQELPFSMVNNALMDQDPSIARGVIEAAIFRKGFKADLRPEKNALAKLRTEFSEEIEKARKGIEQAENDRRDWNTKMADLHKAQGKAFSELVNVSEKGLKNLDTTFREKIRLLAAEKYWGAKKTGHVRAMVISGAIFIAIVLTILVVMGSNWEALLEFLTKTSTGPLTTKLVILGVPAFLVLWLMRLTSRIFLTNFSQYGDASERVVMLSVFFALMEDAKKVSEEDRILILQALFRPSSISSAGDEAPPHWLGILLKRMQKPP